MAVRYDDFLNGAGAAPEYHMPESTALPTRPADGSTDNGSGKSLASSRSILIAWVALLALLVFAHVVTLDVQA